MSVRENEKGYRLKPNQLLKGVFAKNEKGVQAETGVTLKGCVREKRKGGIG